jgi:hypothetical protein
MVTLHVGQKRKKFTAHKKVICTIDYFEKAFNGRFKEAEDGEMYMPEESPEVVGLFIVWLYRGIIPNGNSQKYLDSLYDLYIFGEKIRVIKLMDKIIDKIQDISLAYNKYIDIDFLCKVYQNTRENSEMRRYSAYLFIFKKWKDKQASIRNSATALVLEYVPDASEEVIQGISKERIFDQQPFFNPDEIVEFWVKAKDNLDLSRDIFDYVQTWSSFDLLDPRERDENDEQARCFFHCHSKKNPCRESDSKLFPAWVDDAFAKS